MERLPAYWEEVFSPACLLKEPLFLRTFFQKSHTIESAQPTDSHWYYTTSLPYSFNGKEKDWESGFHYYGARYYWSETLTGWLSVDPMTDKYPSVSPYAYCLWNPVKLVDPDGNEALENEDWYKDGKGRLKWDPTVTKETTLNEGEEYLGNTVLLSNNEGQTVYGDEQGKLHPSVSLAEVNVTADAAIKEKDATVEVPVIVSIGTFLWNELSTAVGTAIETVATIAWIIPASLLFSGDTRQCATDNGNDDVQTSAGQKTDRYGNVLGGSGKPRVNTVHHPTQKKAKDAARNQGKGRPVKHPSPKVGEPHYHPTDRNGLKKPNSPHHGF